MAEVSIQANEEGKKRATAVTSTTTRVIWAAIHIDSWMSLFFIVVVSKIVCKVTKFHVNLDVYVCLVEITVCLNLDVYVCLVEITVCLLSVIRRWEINYCRYFD